MTERILGEKGGKRRKRLLFLPALVVLAVALWAISGAQAVHEAGLLELDNGGANAVTETTEDWDLICKDNPATCTLKAGFDPGGATTASASSHENDGPLNATIFTGGGSKDPQPIANWLWKDGAGGLPDKDNLLHAYAARYNVPSNAGCVGNEGKIDGTDTCSVIYFGSDRFANDGDATQAFWFLQNPVAANGPPSGGGNKFTGSHRDGDVLLISEFSNGGTKSTITVYKWAGDDATGGLQFLATQENSDCDVVQLNDPFCGIVNKGTTPVDSPWDFLDKAGSTKFRQGELFEAGINLSHPGISLEEECFSSFVAETRSSTSTTATLKDFVVGQFQQCTATTTTAPSATSVTVGQSVTDTATITGTGAAVPPFPSSPPNVTFYICEPSQLTPANSGTCQAPNGTQVGDTKALSPTATQGASSATSDPYSTTGKAPGKYCFRTTWAGDDNYPAGSNNDGEENECFQVIKLQSSIATDQWVYPNDKATVSSQGGATITGNVTFKLYDTLANCQANGATGLLYGPQTVALAGGATSKTAETNNTSIRVSTDTTVFWRAEFVPTDTLHFGRVSDCSENTQTTFTNSAGPGTHVP